MSIESLTGLNKAAVLLICIGEEASAKIFNELSDEEVRKVTRAMAAIDHIPIDIKEKVFSSFAESQEEFAGLFVKGNEFAKNAISAIDEGGRNEVLLDQFISGTESRSLETIALMQPQMVAGLLEKEHPQTVALILSTQHVEHAAEIMSFLPETMQSDVVYRIAKLDKVAPEVLSNIENALNKEIGLVAGKEQKEIGGLNKVVEMLGNMKNNLDVDILETMEETGDGAL